MDASQRDLLQIALVILMPIVLTVVLSGVVIWKSRLRYKVAALCMATASVIGMQQLFYPPIVRLVVPSYSGPATFPSPLFFALLLTGLGAMAVTLLLLGIVARRSAAIP